MAKTQITLTAHILDGICLPGPGNFSDVEQRLARLTADLFGSCLTQARVVRPGELASMTPEVAVAAAQMAFAAAVETEGLLRKVMDGLLVREAEP